MCRARSVCRHDDLLMQVFRRCFKLNHCVYYFNVLPSRSFSECYYNVIGPKHTSRYDNLDEVDTVVEKNNITIMDFFKSPEYQMIKATTPTPSSVLNSFYDYSPPFKPIEKELIQQYNIERWSLLQLDGYHRMTDFLWHLGVNGLLNKQDVERLSYNFSIAELSVNDGIKAIMMFEGMKPALNICSLAMYEHLFHDKPVTTEELYQLALALGKVKHSIETLTLPLVAILHKKQLQVEERVKLFLAVSRLDPNINLIEFYTFTGFQCQGVNVFKVLCIDEWVDIIKRRASEECQLSNDTIALKPQYILQLFNGLSNLSIEWLVGSVHKRIELKRLWDSNLNMSPDRVYTYRTPLEIFCKTLIKHFLKYRFKAFEFYVVEENSSSYPIHGTSLSHVVNILYQIGIDLLESSEYSRILSLIEQLTPACLTDILEFIKPIKDNIRISIHLLECFFNNIEKRAGIAETSRENEVEEKLPEELKEIIKNIDKESNNNIEKRLIAILNKKLINNS